jgi:hypothetical protein
MAPFAPEADADGSGKHSMCDQASPLGSNHWRTSTPMFLSMTPKAISELGP